MKKKVIPSVAKCVSFLALFANSFFTYSQQDYYWVGGSGNWSDFSNHWATSSGGSEFHTSIPGQEDNVFFDENSFSDIGQVVTLDISGVSDNRIHDMDWRGSTFFPSLVTQVGTDNYLRIHGSLYFQENMTVDVAEFSLQVYSSGEHAVFDPAGIDLTASEIRFLVASDASLSLVDSLSTKLFGTGNSIDGSFTTNGHPIHTTDIFQIDDKIFGSLDLSGSYIYTKSFEVSSATLEVLLTNEVIVDIVYSDGKTQMRSYGSEPLISNYNIKTDHEIVPPPGLLEEGSFDKLTIEPGVELTISSSLDYGLEFNDLVIEGTSDNRISILSEEEGQVATLNAKGDDVIFNNVDFKDVAAIGEATYSAYRSRDLGNVTGINFIKLDQELLFDITDKDFEDINEVFILPEQTDVELPILYTVENEEVAEVINGNELIIKDFGVTRIVASQGGNEFYNVATPVERFLEVTKADQVITFSEIENTWIGEEFVNLNTSVSSGLAIDYQVSGPASVDGSVLEFSGTGTVQVIASQSGNENYNAAEPVIRSFEVFKKEQVVTFSEIPDTSEDAGFVNLDAISDSGLPISYTVVGPGEVVDGTLEFTGNGMVQVTAKQDGNNLYLAAENVRRAFEILASETEKPLFLTQPEGLGLVYPNPVADYLYFDPQLKIEAVRVSDLFGKVFFDGRLEGDHLDARSWNFGNYIILIRTVEGEEITTQIIRN